MSEDPESSSLPESQSHARPPTDDIYPVQSIYGDLQGLTPPPEELRYFVPNAHSSKPSYQNSFVEPPSPPRTDRSSPSGSSRASRASLSSQGNSSPSTNPNTPDSYAAMDHDMDIRGRLSPDILVRSPVGHIGSEMPAPDSGDLDLSDLMDLQDFANDNNPFFDFNSAASSPKPSAELLYKQKSPPLQFVANQNHVDSAFHRRSGHVRTDSNVSKKRARDDHDGSPPADFHRFPPADVKMEHQPHFENEYPQTAADGYNFQSSMNDMQMFNYSHNYPTQPMQHQQLPPSYSANMLVDGSFRAQYQLSVEFPKHSEKGPGNPNAPPVKSRVETQIAVRFTLRRLPDSVTKLRLPRHTISKIKYIDDNHPAESPEVLELEATVVCASAMQVKDQLERALYQARGEPIPEWILRTQKEKLASEQTTMVVTSPEANGTVASPKDASQAGKDEKKTKVDYSIPLFGAPVAICEQCINRERKRAGRKKNKKPEEEKKWAEDEKKRIVLFNTPQMRQFERVPSTDGTMFAETQMRLCCYCRHHGEKDGFRVIFTMKDCMGTVVAQTISDTIVITDDHKNHPAGNATAGMSPARTENPASEKTAAHSHSPMSIYSPNPNNSSQMQTPGQAPPYSQHYPNQISNRNMSDHSIPSTPSRQSPAPQAAPQTKRRKGSKVPASLAMTPSDPSAMFTTPQYGNPFDPRQVNQQLSQSQWLGAPTTPISQPPQFGADTAYFTNMAYSPGLDNANFGRMKSPAALHMSLQPHNGFNHNMQSSMMSQNHGQPMRSSEGPQVARVVPSEGTCRGGIEVTVLGRGFVNGLTVLFGESSATETAFYSDTTLLCRLPPNPTPGAVVVSLKNIPLRPDALNLSIFTYVDDIDRDLMALALNVVGMKMRGSESGSTKQIALSILRDSNISTEAIEGRGGNHQLADSEKLLLFCLDTIDMDESPHPAKLNLRNKSGQTMLHLACMLGMQKFVAGLLARGAHPNQRDKNGYTPLHFAALFKKPDVVRRLLINRADPGLRNHNGETAADLGESNQIVRETRSVQQSHSRQHSRSSSVSSESRYGPRRGSLPPLAVPKNLGREAVDDFYDSSDDGTVSDSEDSEEPAPSSPWTAGSRRNSLRELAGTGDIKTHSKSHSSTSLGPAISTDQPTEAQPSAAVIAAAWMDAWREQLAQSLQNIHINMPGLPAAAADYQTMFQNHMARLQNPMANMANWRPPFAQPQPGNADYKWSELFHPPQAPPAPASPPAYNELYPTGAGTQTEEKQSEATSSSLERQPSPHLEDIRELQRDLVKGERKINDKEHARHLAHLRKMKRIQSDRRLYFFWIPMLLIVMMLMFFTNGPQLWAFTEGIFDFAQTFRNGPEAVRNRIQMLTARAIGVPG